MNYAFYEVEERDFVKTICRIIEKAYHQNYKQNCQLLRKTDTLVAATVLVPKKSNVHFVYDVYISKLEDFLISI